ncbi:DUF6643 family protein [Streptomyces thermolilacinus]|uniref:Uncharacterized protein n=1 Tax=Streptomyces thermolilacinus SPC6 TaxID=1306406 RepID=A0A1D3DYL0_9ACTN|nr:DUF6643 family protein [Streptomyces thermolilacinus]OEJ97407.1 hypothetical protein J116_026080 [Streptomyces thermolilacinus SPC6]
MTSPRASYGGAYYHAPSFPDTPIYDSLVAERGTPQIAPIRVPAAYDTGNSYLPALPAALPALPAAPSPQPSAPSYGGGYGYPQQAQAPQYAPAQYAPAPHPPAPYVPQQAQAPRGYPGPQGPQPMRPVAPAASGYEAMRPAAAPRPAPAPPAPYDDPYRRPYQGGGY